jgi:glycosyltransferase involved in cell wall biosynthesis
MPKPLISVVMPVYNGLPFLEQSIESILNQSLTDFEFVILNDGSTDESERALRNWEQKDARIRVLSSPERLGLVGSSNFVVSQSYAEFVARMDADDLCERERLVKQWEVLQHNPDVVVVGTLCDGIDAEGRFVRPRDRSRIIRRSRFAPFPHGSVMFRRSTFNEVGGYRLETEGFEDQDLLRRSAKAGRVVTLPDVLYRYRYHDSSSSIASRANAVAEKKLSSIYFSGAMRLWAGHKPEIRDAIRKDPARWSLKKLMIVTWASWGDLHAPSLRALMKLTVRIRDLLAGAFVRDGRFYEWRCK